MRQIKEKAPATPASVTSANINNHNQDTTNPTKSNPLKSLNIWNIAPMWENSQISSQ